MNDVLKNLFERKSARIFEEREISEDIKNIILDSAIQGPTAGNQVLYTILDIEDYDLKEKLAETCDKQTFIKTAPLVLVFLADCRRWYDCYTYAGANPREPELGDLTLAFQDAIIAAQNTVVAAESFGIGSCYIGDIIEEHEKVADFLNLDPFVFPISMIVYGYPTKQQAERKKPIRFDKKYIVQKNTYRRLSEDEHREMQAEVHPEETFEFDRYISAFCKRKYMSEFSKEMSRSAKIYYNNFIK